MLEIFEYEKGWSPRECGLAHGEHFRDKIREIANIRVELVQKNWGEPDRHAVIEVGDQHLELFKNYDANLYAEFEGICEASGLSLGEGVVLNHYTDLRDLRPKNTFPEEGCSAIFTAKPERLLGQTWDMHKSAAPYVVMLKVPHPEPMWVLSIMGCLGLCGLNQYGVGVTINNLISTDAQVGIVWPALVRKLLSLPSAKKAEEHLVQAPIGSGHHYIVADPRSVAAVETSGQLCEAMVIEDRPYIHTNHSVHPQVQPVTLVSDTSTTHERWQRLEEYRSDAQQDWGRVGMWSVLNSKRKFPCSIYTDNATAENPHGMFTCAAIMMQLTEQELWVRSGLEPVTETLKLDFVWSNS